MQIETWFNTNDIKRFYFPGRIIAGVGALKHAINICSDSDGAGAIVIDKMIYQMPCVGDMLSRLTNNISGMYLIEGAPIAQDVMEFVDGFGAQPAFVLAIGGGSATDFAKAVVAMYMFEEVDGIGLSGNFTKYYNCVKPLLVCIPTTAGSGAEASRYYVTYDSHDHHKVFGKSWSLIADWIVIDPIFLKLMPDKILVSCAFDAFVHFFETLICQYERSRMSEMFSLYGICHVMLGLNQAIYQGNRSDAVHTALMEMATLGGVAISNVRTGNIHEAAGALLEITDLSHPETLFVFFRDSIEQYIDAISDHEKKLIAQLQLFPEFISINSIDDVISWWEGIFKTVYLENKIRIAIDNIKPITEKARRYIFDRVYSDKVWINKESPVKLDELAIKKLIDKSLTRFETQCAK